MLRHGASLMAYTPPNIFADGTVMQAAQVAANNTALRTYLNIGVASADIT